jgi:hypothetical protein
MRSFVRDSALLVFLALVAMQPALAMRTPLALRRGRMPSAAGAMRLRGGAADPGTPPAEEKSLANHAVDYALAGYVSLIRPRPSDCPTHGAGLGP